MLAIETVNLCKKYNKTVAVSNLNLKIEEGEIFTLLGLNGAGKTIIFALSVLIHALSANHLPC